MPFSLTSLLECSRCCHVLQPGLPSTGFSHGRRPSHEQWAEVPGRALTKVGGLWSINTPVPVLLSGITQGWALHFSCLQWSRLDSFIGVSFLKSFLPSPSCFCSATAPFLHLASKPFAQKSWPCILFRGRYRLS